MKKKIQELQLSVFEFIEAWLSYHVQNAGTARKYGLYRHIKTSKR